MSWYVAPFHDSYWSPLSLFKNDVRMMKRVLQTHDPSSRNADTVYANYSYKATAKEVYFDIEMPGVRKENITIDVDDLKLVIKGKRIKDLDYRSHGALEEIKNEGLRRNRRKSSERKKDDTHNPTQQDTTLYLTYMFKTRLKHNADVKAIKADNCGDGILRVHVPMKLEKNTHRVPVGH